MAAEQDRTDFDENVDLPDEHLADDHSDDLTETALDAESGEVAGDDAADSDASESDTTEDAADDTTEAGEDGKADKTDEPAAETPEEAAQREAEERLLELFQSTVYGTDGQKLGRVGQVYLDDQTQEPNWVTVKTGFFGIKEYFVPLDLAERDGKRLTVPYTKEQVTSAPRTEIDQNLSPAEEDDLYAHYQVPGKLPEHDPLLVESADATEEADAVSVNADPIEADDASPLEAEEAAADESLDDVPVAEPAVADEAFAPAAVEGDEDATVAGADEDAVSDEADEPVPSADDELDATSLDLETDPEVEKPEA
ncbi:PRC-barrel domain-containing protein [Gulosibacter hominis]|uniref:PRC-barrel domain-containing protein n=1 Tax=Gulosibacter hominis TaxID=2770504 RepID=UPI00191829C0|nr:PRC-barrel domain-containing protein [Gulosibacter hominis]